MTPRVDDRPRLLTRAFWVMMALAGVSFIAAAVVVALGPRLLAAHPVTSVHAPPLAGTPRSAKDAHARSPLGPP